MSLSKRLIELSKLVLPNVNVYDVGADHGILETLIEDKVNRIKAIENKKGPYLNLVKNTKHLKKVTSYLGNDLSFLDKDDNFVIFAGLGSRLIIDILKKHQDKISNVEYLLIDSHSELPLLRKEITSLGFIIDKEVLILDKGIFYNIMRFVKGKKEYSEEELLFGISLKESECFDAYLDKEKERLFSIINNNKVEKKKKDETKKHLERMLNYYGDEETT